MPFPCVPLGFRFLPINAENHQAGAPECDESSISPDIPVWLLSLFIVQRFQFSPRHRFVPESQQASAYADTPLSIGSDQTISQPYIVAYMTDALQLPADATVLEIGTGSGYQAAVLAEVAREVYSIEIVPERATRSAGVLEELGHDNVHVRRSAF